MTNSRSQQNRDVASPERGSVNFAGNTLKIVPLGGLGEIGKNVMAIAYGGDIMLVDGGLAFPDEEMLGVDLVLPDISFLVEHQSMLRGMAITHGHEDHIGGIPFMLKDVTIPSIYGPALALGLLEGKLREVGLESRTTLSKVRPRQVVKIGCFSVQFIRCTHSIADSFSLIIRTPIGVLVHTGDFKFDFTPVDGELFDIASLAAAGDEGVLLLMSDSTNTEREGFTPSERTVWRKINEVFANAKKRIIFTTFASNVHRIRQVLQAALKYDRKVAILGRSMLNLASIARELGYMNFPDGLLVTIDQINSLPADRVVILTTGSQGEPLSALSRIANDGHKQVKIIEGDTVIISATPIPGNERSVANTINALCTRGADVVYGRDAGVHVSGHGCQEEQKLMINVCRPKFFMPIHGEYRMLVRHAELATECGVAPDNSFVMDNGDVLELTAQSGAKIGKVKSGILLIDSSRAWEINEQILAERRHLAEDGLVTISMTMGSNRSRLEAFDLSMKGLILPGNLEPEDLVAKTKQQMIAILAREHQTLTNLEPEDLQSYFQGVLSRFFQSEIRTQPYIQVILHLVSDHQDTTSKPAGSKALKHQ
jgi:ribonuclease J